MEDNYIVNDQKELITLLDAMVEYLRNKPWSTKKKNKVFTAFLDISSRGITGTHYKDGSWYVDINDGSLNLSDKDLDFYGLAADFISSHIRNNVPQKTKKETIVFDNSKFTNDFDSYIGLSEFGGQKDWIDTWNNLDAEERGIRKTDVRASKLATALENYSKTLEDGKYSFENTSFSNLNDFKAKLNNAITALRDGVWNQNDADALNKIGINPEKYLSTGENDKIQLTTGEVITRRLYNDLQDLQKQELADEEKAKQEKLAAEKLAEQTNIKKIKQNVAKFVTLHGQHIWTPGRTKQKLTFNNYKNVLDKAIERGVINLTHSENQQISDFINTYGEPIISGNFAGGKHLLNFPDLVLFNSRLYQQHVTSDVAESAKRLFNLNKNNSKVPPILSEKKSVKINGKDLKVSSIPAGYDNRMMNLGNTPPQPLQNVFRIIYNGHSMDINLNDPSASIKIKQAVAKFLQDSKTPVTQAEIDELKQLGWLKQGGIIDRLKIQQYKEFIRK